MGHARARKGSRACGDGIAVVVVRPALVRGAELAPVRQGSSALAGGGCGGGPCSGGGKVHRGKGGKSGRQGGDQRPEVTSGGQRKADDCRREAAPGREG